MTVLTACGGANAKLPVPETYAERLRNLGAELADFRKTLRSLTLSTADPQSLSKLETETRTKFRGLVARLPGMAELAPELRDAVRNLPVEAHYAIWSELIEAGWNDGTGAIARGLLLDLWDIWLAGVGSNGELTDTALAQGPGVRPAVVRDLLATGDGVFAQLLPADKAGFATSIRTAGLDVAQRISAKGQTAPLSLRSTLYALLRLDRLTQAADEGRDTILAEAATLRAYKESRGAAKAPMDYSAALVDGKDRKAIGRDHAYSVLLYFSGVATDSPFGEYGTSSVEKLISHLSGASESAEDIDDLLNFWAASHPIFGHALADMFDHRFWSPEVNAGPPDGFAAPHLGDLWVAVVGPKRVGKTHFIFATKKALNNGSRSILRTEVEPFPYPESDRKTAKAKIEEIRTRWEAGTADDINTVLGGSRVLARIDTPYYASFRFFDVAGEQLWSAATQAPSVVLADNLRGLNHRALIFFDAAGELHDGRNYPVIFQNLLGDGLKDIPVYIVINKSDQIVDRYAGPVQDAVRQTLSGRAEDLQTYKDARGREQQLPFFSLRSVDVQRLKGGTADVVGTLRRHQGIAKRPLLHAQLAADMARLRPVIDALLAPPCNRDISIVYTTCLAAGAPDHLLPLNQLWEDLTQRLLMATASQREAGFKELLKGRIDAERTAAASHLEAVEATVSQSAALAFAANSAPSPSRPPKVTVAEGDWEKCISHIAKVDPDHPLIVAGKGVLAAAAQARVVRDNVLPEAIMGLLREAGIDLNGDVGGIVARTQRPTTDVELEAGILEQVKEALAAVNWDANGKVSSFSDYQRGELAKLIGRALPSALQATEARPMVAPPGNLAGPELNAAYDALEGVQSGSESRIWERQVSPEVAHRILGAGRITTIGELFAMSKHDWQMADQIALVDALYAVSEGNSDYRAQWLRLGSKDLHQFAVLTARLAVDKRAFRIDLLECLQVLYSTLDDLRALDLARFVDYTMAFRVLQHLARLNVAGLPTGDDQLHVLIHSMALPPVSIGSASAPATSARSPAVGAEPAAATDPAPPAPPQGAFPAIAATLRSMEGMFSDFRRQHHSVLDKTSRISAGDAGILDAILPWGRRARTVSALRAFEEILTKCTQVADVVESARTPDVFPVSDRRIAAVDKARRVTSEVLTSHALVEACLAATRRLGVNDTEKRQDVERSLQLFVKRYHSMLAGELRREEFRNKVRQLFEKRRLLNVASAFFYLEHGDWIKRSRTVRQSLSDDLARQSEKTQNLQTAIAGKLLPAQGVRRAGPVDRDFAVAIGALEAELAELSDLITAANNLAPP